MYIVYILYRRYQGENTLIKKNLIVNYTVSPRSSDPFYVVSYYIKWVTTSWTHSYIDQTEIISSYISIET